MNARLLISIGIAVGAAAGNAIYQLVRNGVSEIDCARVIFIALITFAVLLLVPKAWIAKSRA